MRKLNEIISKEIQLYDARTGTRTWHRVWDAKETYGRLRITLEDGMPWFEPTREELSTLRD